MPLPDRRLREAMPGWLQQQRWFAGKGQEISDVAIDIDTVLLAGDPELHHVIMSVHQGTTVDRYQLLVGIRRELPERLRYAQITAPGRPGEGHTYDAVHDPALTKVLLENMAAGAGAGSLKFAAAPGMRIDTGLVSLASPAEQSNTSLVYGETYICKLFRRVTPGINPDLELNLGLAREGCEYIPAPCGWIQMELEPGTEPATLALMSEFLRTGTDGWRLATTSVRDLYADPALAAAEAGGDFAAESERLGSATASVHRDLAAAFGVTELPAEELHVGARRMHAQLAEAKAAVPELAPYAGMISAAFDDLAKLDRPMPAQRVHGDYHLGQVMRTERGWVLLDFEGEPARPAAQRRAPAHPLRDVAGMLRSFEYAARFLLADRRGSAEEAERLEARAREWADRNRSAFCRGYAEAGGPDPQAHHVMLRAFELDKAVYEVLYEARNRPAWLAVPLGSLAHRSEDRPEVA